MYLCVLLLAFLWVPFQSQQEQFRQRFEAAEAQRVAGNVDKAENEYVAILADAYQKLGRTYSAQGDHRAAVTVLEEALRRRPNSPDLLVDLSIALFNTSQFKQAIARLDSAVAVNPQVAATYHMRGKCYFMLNEFDKAVADLQKALQLKPQDYDVAYTLALANLKLKQVPAAQKIFDRMLAELGNRPQLRILMGRAYRQTGFLPEAIDEFKKAIALDPRFPRVHYYLGLTYLLKDGAARINDAEAEFRLEVEANPDEFFANYYLGIVSTIQRKWDAAVGFLLKAVRLEPNNPDPYFYLGQAYQGLSKHDDAIEMFRKSIGLTPDLKHNDYQVTNAHYRLGQSLLKAGKTEEGQKELKIAADLKAQAFKRDEAKGEAFLNAANLNEQTAFPELGSAESVNASTPQDLQRQEVLKTEVLFYAKVVAAAHENIGLLNAERQKFRLAAESFSEAAKWDPQLKDIYYNLGLAYFKSELYKDAVAALENDLKQSSDNVNLRTRQLLGLSYFSIENYEKAASLLSEVIAAKPNDVTLYYPLALSLSKLGKTDESQHVVRQMLNYGGDSPQIHIFLAKAYYDQDAPTKALDELKVALTLDSKVRLAHFYSGLVYIKLGKFAEAGREFESELALNPEDLQAKYHLGYVSLANQETKRGMQLMREVIQADPNFGNAYFELGKTQLQQGDVSGAIMSLEKAAKLAPEQAHVHYQLGRAYVAAGRQAEGRTQFELSQQLKEKARNQPNN
jgi:tetratricopeptide (TPR) repeat protein